MKPYLLSAAAVIFLSVLVSLLIPDGKMKKSIIFVMRLACILVLIQPVTGIFKLKNVANAEPLYDYEYICEVYTENQSDQLEKLIFEKFNVECTCNVVIGYENGEFKEREVEVEINSQDEKIIDSIYEYLEKFGYINISVYAKSS